MKLRDLVPIVLFALAPLLAASPGAAAGSDPYALVLPSATLDGRSVVGDLQMSELLADECARTRRTQRECAALQEVTGESLAFAISVLAEAGWTLVDAYPVKWSGPDLDADLACAIRMDPAMIKSISFGGTDSSQPQSAEESYDAEFTAVFTVDSFALDPSYELVAVDERPACADVVQDDVGGFFLREEEQAVYTETLTLNYEKMDVRLEAYEGHVYVWIRPEVSRRLLR
jgi:hypothetical protein